MGGNGFQVITPVDLVHIGDAGCCPVVGFPEITGIFLQPGFIDGAGAIARCGSVQAVFGGYNKKRK